MRIGPFTQTVRSAAILTGSFVAGTVIDGTDDTNGNKVQLDNFPSIVIEVDFTLGSLTDAEIKFEFSHDGVTYRQETMEVTSDSGERTSYEGSHKLPASGSYVYDFNNNVYRYIRVSAKGNGTLTGSSMAISSTFVKN